jgi:hypothetical protein
MVPGYGKIFSIFSTVNLRIPPNRIVSNGIILAE